MINYIDKQTSKRHLFVHNFDKSIFLRSYIQFIYDNYDCEEHLIITSETDMHDKTAQYADYLNKFVVIEKLGLKQSLPFNIMSYINRNIIILKQMKKADLIITHAFRNMWYYIFCPQLLRKVVWVIWGYDLYDYRRRNSSYRNRVVFTIKKHLVKKIPYVVCRDADYKLLQKWYNTNPKQYHIEPLYGKKIEDNISLHIHNPSDPIKITLGNSATVENRHIEALQILSKFKDENIRIYIPLAYGNMEYGATVKKLAQDIFGDKVIVQDKFMSPDEYRIHLANMDIGIFNNNRQQALGNIEGILRGGNKLYINPDSPLWDIESDYGFKIHSITDIPNLTFEEFISYDSEEAKYNYKHIRDVFDIQHAIDGWNAIFALAGIDSVQSVEKISTNSNNK